MRKIFFSVSDTDSLKGERRSYDLLVISQDDLPLKYTRLVGANKENIFKKDGEMTAIALGATQAARVGVGSE